MSKKLTLMIKKLFMLLFLAVISLNSFSQESTYVKGKVTDENNEPVPGVHVYLTNIESGAITDGVGEYVLERVIIGETKMIFSYTGYQTQSVDYTIHDGENNLDVALEGASYNLEPVIVTAQKQEQRINEVPLSISAVNNQIITDLSIQNLSQFSDLVPGLNVRIQSNQRPNFVIRGLSSDEVSPNAQPRVSLFLNKAPVTRASGGVLELYDMDRVEVLKGPQGTLFGRGAQIGAIHFVTKMPTNTFEGYASVGLGSYNQQQFQFAVNTPLIKNKLNARIAAIYNKQDGYIDNFDGAKLNGKDTKAFRFSLRYIPCSKTKVDFVFNYQQDNAPGIGFISGAIPNPDANTDIFSYKSYLNNGEDLEAKKDLLNLNLNIRHYLTPDLYLSFISSYQTNDSYEKFDGDGSLLDALNMTEDINAKLFNQEVRINYSLGKKFKGFTGFNYLREEVDQNYLFSANEQHLAYMLLQMTPYVFYDASGNVYPMTNLPNDPNLGPLAGAPLPDFHSEENLTSATNKAYEIFTDATFEISSKLSVSAGLRIVFDNSRVNNLAQMSSLAPSMLGNITELAPNFLFMQVPLSETKENFSGYTGRFVVDYKATDDTHFFMSYNRGRRPNVIQYGQTGVAEIMDDEIVNSFDIGIKSKINNKLMFDLTTFVYTYKNFQTQAWDTDAVRYIIKDAGNATAFGVETSFEYNITKGLNIFGNYTYINAEYDRKDENGNEQEYADNQFRLTPKHSLNLSIKGSAKINRNLEVFVIPSISYKSDYYFEDTNAENLMQKGFALVNISAGVKALKEKMTLSIYANNLFDKEYLLSAGNMGNFFGTPTFIPAIPRTLGVNLRWNF